MSLLHPSSVGAVVALWFSNGVPVRIVHAGKRYRVVGAPEATADGWMLHASDATGLVTLFEVYRCAEAWALRSVH